MIWVFIHLSLTMHFRIQSSIINTSYSQTNPRHYTGPTMFNDWCAVLQITRCFKHIVLCRVMIILPFKKKTKKIYTINKFNGTGRFKGTFSTRSLLQHSTHVWQCHLRIHWSDTHWDNFSLFTWMGKWLDMDGWMIVLLKLSFASSWLTSVRDFWQ